MSTAFLVLICVGPADAQSLAVTEAVPAALAGMEDAIVTQAAAHKIRGSGGGPVCWGTTFAGTPGAVLPICIRNPGSSLGTANGWVGKTDQGIAGMHRNLPYRQGYPQVGADRGVSLR